MLMAQVTNTYQFEGEHTGYYRYEFGFISGKTRSTYILDFDKSRNVVESADNIEIDPNDEALDEMRRNYSAPFKEISVIGEIE